MIAPDRAALLPVLTAYRAPAPEPGRLAAYLLAAGVRLVLTPAGWQYADCPACGTFGALSVDADGARWRSACGCFGRRPLGEPEAVGLFHRLTAHAA